MLLFAASVHELSAESNANPGSVRERARSLHERAAVVDPANPRARAALGRSYLSSDDPAQAKRAVHELEAAVRIATWDPRLELDLGRSHLKSGAREAARRILTRLIGLPHPPEVAGEARRLLDELEDAPERGGVWNGRRPVDLSSPVPRRPQRSEPEGSRGDRFPGIRLRASRRAHRRWHSCDPRRASARGVRRVRGSVR